MRVRLNLILPYSWSPPAGLIERLLSIAPHSEVSSPKNPWWSLDEQDPRLTQLLSILHNQGLKERPSEEAERPTFFSPLIQRVRRLLRLPPSNASQKTELCYNVVRWRQYEPADYTGVQFLEPESAERIIAARDRAADGRIQIDFYGVPDLSPEERAAPLLNGQYGMLVPERIKQRLEIAGFKGMVFRPTSVGRMIDDDRRREIKWSKVGIEPLWEWRSDITMPWVAPQQNVMDAVTRLPLKGNDRRSDAFVYILPEPTFNRAELIYSRQELDATLPPGCDAAMTRERTWRIPEDDNSQLIVSARVREWWLEEGLAADNWTPVRVVP